MRSSWAIRKSQWTILLHFDFYRGFLAVCGVGEIVNRNANEGIVVLHDNFDTKLGSS